MSEPIQDDVKQAVNSGEMADTTSSLNVSAPAVPNQAAQNPSNVPQSPDAPAGGRPAPQVPVQPQGPPPQKPTLHARIFDSIMKMGAGRQAQDQNGRPVPMTHGQMGRAILAGAISGMLAGYGTEHYQDTKYGPVRVNSPAAGVAAGAQAGEKLQNDRQQQVDEQQARATNTLKRNLDLHATMMNAQKMDYEQQQSLLKDTQPLIDGLNSFDESNTDPNVPKFVLDRGLSGDELMAKYHVAKNNAILDGWRAHIDPQTGQQTMVDGVPQYEPTFTAINPEAVVHFNPALKEQLSKSNPELSRIPDNMPIKAKAILGAVQNGMNMQIAQNAITGWQKQNDELNGGKSDSVDVNKLIHDNPTLRRAVPFINKYIGEDPDQMIAGLRKEKDPTAQAAAGILASKLGIDEDKWKNKRLAEQKKIGADEAVEKDKATGAYAERQVSIANKLLENKKLQADLELTKNLDIKDNGTVINGVNPDFISKLPPGMQATVKAIGEGRQDVSPRMLQSKQGQQLSEIINRAYPGFDFTMAQTYAKTRANFTSGKDATAIEAVNVALNHAGQMFKHVDALSTLPGVSDIAQLAGNKDAVAVNSIRAALASEIAKSYAAQAFTQGEKDEYEKLLKAKTPMELKGNLHTLANMLEGKFDALNNKWQNGTPAGYVRPVRIVSPAAERSYKLITGEEIPVEMKGAPITSVSKSGQFGWDGRNWIRLTGNNPEPVKMQQ